MPLVIPEDVGTTRRGHLSARRRLQAWERTNGKCVVCGDRIDGVRERWIVEHIRALELGGVDELDNMGPAHEACGREKTRDDHARAAQAKRQKLRHIGAVHTVQPLPGSRTSLLKRKIDGTVVRRERQADREAVPRIALERPVGSSASAPVEPALTNSGLCCTPEAPSGRGKVGSTERSMAEQRTGPEAAGLEAESAVAEAGREILPALPHHLVFLFDDRPLLPGESAEQYDAILRSIVQQVRPADVIDALWVKDVVVQIWEAKRLRLWRGQILAQARLDAAKAVVKRVLEVRHRKRFVPAHDIEAEAQGIALDWLKGTSAGISSFESFLTESGLTAGDLMAQAFQVCLSDIERIDRMAANADHRRDALLREIERKRASLGQHLRAASSEIIDVEPTNGATKPIARS